jgi:hypothetical protein
VDGQYRRSDDVAFRYERQTAIPPDGYDIGGKHGIVQGMDVAPSGDVWALDSGDNKLVYLPKGDPSEVKFFCQSADGKQNKDSPHQWGPIGHENSSASHLKHDSSIVQSAHNAVSIG